ADNAASVSIKLMRLRGERADKGGWNGARNAGRCNPHIDFRQLPAFNSVFKDTRENLGMGAAEKGALFGKVHIHRLGEQRKGEAARPNRAPGKGAQYFNEPFARRSIARSDID